MIDMENDKKWNLTKFLIIPIIVFLIMSNEISKKERFMERVQYQHQLDSLRNDNSHIFREMNYQIEELRRDIEGMYHEQDIIKMSLPEFNPDDIRG
jgi:hypothetical protein